MRFLVGLRIFLTNIALPIAVAIGVGLPLYWEGWLISSMALSLIMAMHFFCQQAEGSRIRILDFLPLRWVLSLLMILIAAVFIPGPRDLEFLGLFRIDLWSGDAGRLMSWIIALLPAAPFIAETAFETVFGD